MLEGLSLNLNDAGAQIRLVGEKILHALNEHHDLAGLSYHSTASIGITLFAHQTDTVDELLKRADLAMYQAKAAADGSITGAGRRVRAAAEPGLKGARPARSKRFSVRKCTQRSIGRPCGACNLNGFSGTIRFFNQRGSQ